MNLDLKMTKIKFAYIISLKFKLNRFKPNDTKISSKFDFGFRIGVCF